MIIADEIRKRARFERTTDSMDFLKLKQAYNHYSYRYHAAHEQGIEVIMLRRHNLASVFHPIVMIEKSLSRYYHVPVAFSTTKVYRKLRASFPSMKCFDHGRSVRFSAEDEALIWLFLS